MGEFLLKIVYIYFAKLSNMYNSPPPPSKKKKKNMYNEISQSGNLVLYLIFLYNNF